MLISATIRTLREIAPLKPSEQSVMADTSDCTLDESIALVVKIIKENIA